MAPKVATLLTEAEEDLLAFYRFPPSHRPKLRSTNNLERVNKEIARRSDVVGIFPDDRAVIRLVGALPVEQDDEWLLTRGHGAMKECRRVRHTTTRDLTGENVAEM